MDTWLSWRMHEVFLHVYLKLYFGLKLQLEWSLFNDYLMQRASAFAEKNNQGPNMSKNFTVNSILHVINLAVFLCKL